MDWYTPDPNVKVSLEKAQDALKLQVLESLIRSFEKFQAQFSRCRKSSCHRR